MEGFGFCQMGEVIACSYGPVEKGRWAGVRGGELLEQWP